MRHPILFSDMLREGRNLRMAMMIIFYDAILAFVTILFLLFNTESYEGNLYSYSPYRTQFFMISLIQILAIFIIIPFLVESCFSRDRESHVTDQFVTIPNFAEEYIVSKFVLVFLEYEMINFSSLPILTMYCSYGSIGWREILRLMIMLTLFTFWAASVSVFSFSVISRSVQAISVNVLILSAFFLGTLMSVELIRSSSSLAGNYVQTTPLTNTLSLFFMAVNPISSGIGYYVNITGNNEIVSSYCSHLGIDNTSSLFIFFYYKLAALACLITGLAFLGLAILKMRRERKI